MVTKGMELPIHEHRKAELILTLRGVVRCEAEQGIWIVPPRCAVWIPDNVPHSVTFAGNVEVYVLFVEPDAVPALPRQCRTLSISPLLERLLLHATQMPVLYDVDGADGRIACQFASKIDPLLDCTPRVGRSGAAHLIGVDPPPTALAQPSMNLLVANANSSHYYDLHCMFSGAYNS
jgi:hypothetical protein